VFAAPLTQVADLVRRANGLDEEEHSLDRLRRWSRDLKARDIFGVPEGMDADDKLKRCVEILDGYAEEVYAAAHAPLGRNE
jgi:hypothetical protein